MKDELAKTKPKPEILKELMARTHPNRREWILDANAERTVGEIINEYPLLKKGTYVSEGHIIMHNFLIRK